MSLDIHVGTHAVAFELWRPGLVLAGPKVALDTETEPIRDNTIPRLAITSATDGQRGVFVAREHLNPFLHAHHDRAWLFHNAAFDIPVLAQAGCDLHPLLEVGQVFDTAILYRLLKLADMGNCHGYWALDHIAQEFLGLTLPKDVKATDGRDIRTTYDRFIRADGRVDYPALLAPENRPYLLYAGGDPVATFLVAEVLTATARKLFECQRLDPFDRATYEQVGSRDGVALGPAWTRFGFLTHDIQLKASIALASVERAGMALDPASVGGLADYVNQALQECKAQLKSGFGWASGPGSMARFAEVLKQIERTLDEALPRTETGQYARGAEDLEEYADRAPFIRLYLQHEELNKLRAVFMAPMARSYSSIRGRFNVLVNTGRTSCGGRRDEAGQRTGLNLQNLPREGAVRSCFTASPGHLLFACDYSTIELVTLAQHALRKFGWSSMADAIRRNADLHCVYAARRAGVRIDHLPVWDKKSIMPLLGAEAEKLRSNAKPANFGYPGGLGAASFVAFARTAYGVEISEEEARKERESWLAAWPEMELHLASDDLHLLAPQFPALWAAHPSARGNFAAGEIPWPIHILRGVLTGRTATSTTMRPYSPGEVEWAWTAAAEIAARVEGIPASQRISLGTRVRERIAGTDLWNALAPRQRFVGTLSGRLRGFPRYCAARNTVFQGLAADGAKLALYRLYREGFRVVNFIHDEVLIEFPINADHTALARRVEAIMVEEMRQVVPDLPVTCEYALMRRWYKGAKALFEAGILVPVKPVTQDDGHIHWMRDET